MTTKAHKLLTGTDLHEPKGAATAPAGQVYVSDGAGSGIWTTINTTVSFSTGDLKPTHKQVADTGWIMWTNGTIGDASSGATIRANADTFPLYALYWAVNYSGINISGGRGGSAAADFVAHKTLTLPAGNGRALGIAGQGNALTLRLFLETNGAETVTLARSDLPNTSVGVTITDPGHTHTLNTWFVTSVQNGSGTSQGNLVNTAGGSAAGLSATAAATGITAAFNLNGAVTQTSVSLLQPTTWVNVMIKL